MWHNKKQKWEFKVLTLHSSVTPPVIFHGGAFLLHQGQHHSSFLAIFAPGHDSILEMKQKVNLTDLKSIRSLTNLRVELHKQDLIIDVQFQSIEDTSAFENILESNLKIPVQRIQIGPTAPCAPGLTISSSPEIAVGANEVLIFVR